jgi:hypothetical protein
MAATKIKLPLALTLLLIPTLACGSVLPQPESTATSVIQVIPTQTQIAGDPPVTEAGLPRITVEDAKAAVDIGEAIIVDVRSTEAYAISHIKNAVSIPLVNIENNPASLSLDKNQWIITYCT